MILLLKTESNEKIETNTAKNFMLSNWKILIDWLFDLFLNRSFNKLLKIVSETCSIKPNDGSFEVF